jgi:hypothetical protein
LAGFRKKQASHFARIIPAKQDARLLTIEQEHNGQQRIVNTRQ